MDGIELVGCPDSAKVFVPKLGRMAESLEVVFVLLAALNVHSARIPVPVLGCRLRPPMGPDAKFGVLEPLGDLI